MEIDKINTKKLYTIKGKGRAEYYKITSVDKIEKKVYLVGLNIEYGGYVSVDKIRVFSPKMAAKQVKLCQSIISEIKKRYSLIF